MSAAMTCREMNLKIFQGQPIPHVLFQPRIEPWVDLSIRKGTFPPAMAGLEMRDVYKHLGLSMRYIQYFTGQPDPVQRSFSRRVKIHSAADARGGMQVFDTPYGELVTRFQAAGEAGCRIVDFPVHGPEDLRKLQWLYENTLFSYNQDNFEKGAAYLGDLGEAQFFLPRSPYQSLALDWMKFEQFAIALMEDPGQFESVIKAIDASYDPLFSQLSEASGPNVLNFGENIDAQLLSPRFFETYHIPFYQKRAEQLRKGGKFTHAHFDGSLKAILKYLRHLPFDGIEALTAAPMGDVTLEQIKENLGDKILLDGIPAVLFLPPFTLEDIQACVEKVVKLFSPGLVLGISDEIPMACGPEAIKSLEWIRDYCRSTKHPSFH